MTRTRALLWSCLIVLAAARTASAQSFEAVGAASHLAPASNGAAAAVNAVSVGALPTALTVLPAASAPSFAPASSAPSGLRAAPGAASPLSAAPAARAPALPSRLHAGADGPTPLQAPLRPGERWTGGDPRLGEGDVLVHDGPRGRELVPLSSFEPSAEPVDWRSSRARSAAFFDGVASHPGGDAEAPAVAGGLSPNAGAPLAKAVAAASKTAAAVPAAKRAPRSFTWKVALGVLLLFLLSPGIALAQTAAAPVTITVAGTLGILAALRPAAASVGAIAGAVYGMIAARPKDGSEASAADSFASVLRYGALGGASVYMLLDVTSMAFPGAMSAGLQPLSSAIVTAALGRTAFQGKFMDPATSSADRIVGAFPAVAAALGISLGIAAGFVAVPTLTTVALTAMTVTGVITALYTALFKLGRSPLDGPAWMAKGYVLQSLMMGLALATTGHWLPLIFAAMGAAGFGMVLWAMGRELLSFLPGRATPAPPVPGPKV